MPWSCSDNRTRECPLFRVLISFNRGPLYSKLEAYDLLSSSSHLVCINDMILGKKTTGDNNIYQQSLAVSTTPSVFSFDATSTSVHLPFVFSSPPASALASLGMTNSHHNFCISPVSTCTTNFVSSPLVTPSISTGSVTQSLAVSPTVSSGIFHCTTSSPGKTIVSLPEVSSMSGFVPVVTVVSLQSPPVTKSSTTRALASVSTTKGSSLKTSPVVNKESVSLSVHSSKVTPTKSSMANTSLTVKKPKTITSRMSSSSVVSAVSLPSSKTKTFPLLTKYIYDVTGNRTTGQVKIGYLSGVKQGDEMECVVTEVISPSEFWIQPAKYELIRLMNNLE